MGGMAKGGRAEGRIGSFVMERMNVNACGAVMVEKDKKD